MSTLQPPLLTLAALACAIGLVPRVAAEPPEPPSRGPSKPSTASLEPRRELADRALAVVETHCASCHGGARFGARADQGGFDFALSAESLVARGLIVRYQPDESELFQRVRDREMPPAEVTIRPGADEVEILRAWIAAGAPAPAPATEARAARRFLGLDAVYARIRGDLARAPADARQHYRYVSLAHLWDAGQSEPELDLMRQAVAKLVNSLTWASHTFRPEAIDRERLILRLDLRALGWGPELWERIVADDPYAFARNAPDARAVYRETGAPAPLVRADWLVSAAARPPLYHDILALPARAGELERRLGVNAAADIRRGRVIRAGFNRSGVSQHNRVIERQALRAGGYLWRSYDFANSTGTRNVFDRPLGPATSGSDPDSFTHDGGEIIFSLPNGFQGYLLVDARGRRIDKAPTEIVTDPGRPDGAVENGLSCMSCHVQGLLDKADQIRPHVASNRAAFDRRNPETTRRVLALYPPADAFASAMERDRARFARALAAAGVSSEVEPIAFAARAFEAELDLAQAAAELGLTADALAGRLRGDEVLARKLGALLVAGGTVKRDAFVAVFPLALERLGAGVALAALSPEQRLVRLCEDGSGADCARAGDQLATGRGVRPDSGLAVRLYERACARSFAPGCTALGALLAAGQGVGRDRARAAASFSRGCDLGDPAGCEALARALAGGDGVARDRARAAQVLARACRAGRSSACHELAEARLGGRGVARDRRGGLQLLERTCGAGFAPSCRRAADILEDGAGDIAENEAKAAFLYRKACNAGDVESCVEAGEMYYDGDGVPEQRALSAQLYGKACDAGSAEGCHRLAHQVRSGKGVRKDKARASALFRRACQLGKHRACARL